MNVKLITVQGRSLTRYEFFTYQLTDEHYILPKRGVWILLKKKQPKGWEYVDSGMSENVNLTMKEVGREEATHYGLFYNSKNLKEDDVAADIKR